MSLSCFVPLATALAVLFFLLWIHNRREQSSWLAVRRQKPDVPPERDLWAAGVKVDRVQMLAAGVVAAAGGALAVYAVTGLAYLAPAGLLAGVAAPRLWLSRLVRGRAKAFESGFQVALAHMAASLRAGQNVDQAFEQAAVAAEGPARDVLGLVVHLRRSGDSVSQALEKARHLVKSPSLDMAAAATALHSRTGGDLALVYDQIADSIRDREAFHAQVQSATSEGRLTANILAALPFVFVGVLRALSPEYMAPLFSPQGLVVLASCTAMVALGYLVLQRIADIEY